MWLIILGFLLASSHGQVQLQPQQNNQDSSTRLPWNRYDEPRDSANPNYVSRINVGQNENLILKEATYFVVASRLVRPGQVYRVAVTILQSRLPMMVRASIQRNGVEMTADHQEVKEGIPETLMLEMPQTALPGDYKFRVEGLYNSLTGGQAFLNDTQLTFSQRAMTIFIQMDKPVYMQGQTIRFRAVPINTELKAFTDPIDVYMLDPNRRIMRRWLSRQSNLGTVSLSYELSDQPVFGNWIIQVVAQSQYEEKMFVVEEYYQTRFEVNVTMPAFFFDTDPYIHGIVQANYTSGAPVRGNLTLKATFRSINPRQTIQGQNIQAHERYFDFNEYLPSWFKRPNEWENKPVLRFFNGTYRFSYPMQDLLAFGSNADGVEVQITATVGERFLEEVIVGYSTARIYNSTVRVHFFGGSPQVFKPAMAFSLNLVASFHDGSTLRPSQLLNAQMEVRADVEMRTGGRRTLDTQYLLPSAENNAIWPMKIDLRKQLGLEENPQRAQQILNEIASMKVYAVFRDGEGHGAQAELLMLAHESPDHKHIKVSTSTKHASVGEYLILHVQTNFYIDTFNYLVMSKGSVVLAGQDVMQHNIRTFSIPLSPEMAPVATAVVYYVGHKGEVVADSLTIPVNGISRNNFTVFINNKKARTGEKVEVAIYGEPGAYVALSGVDRAFYTMQAGNELTYSKVISKMAYFGEETNGTHSHSWLYHDGDPDEIVYFPSSTFGIDVNRTFEYIGLVVFTDAFIYRKPEHCNRTQGYGECLSGRCYRLEKKCDGIFDCEDGTDEARCVIGNATDLALFRKQRFNRIQRQYENVWLWKDINIGPHGRQIFDIDVPRRPVHWMVTAFSMSPSKGYGMLPRALEYTGVLPFFINVEMPTNSRQGEQIGVRVSVFNYQRHNIEATVVLKGSRDYKYVHVEDNGIVQSYKPRTSFGEHQFFIWIAAQDAAVVYLPIVPTRLGDIQVTIHATTVIGSDRVTRTLHVEADGLPQYRHQSILLDLSNKGYLFQYMHINITETPLIPYTEERYYVYGSNKAKISVVGDVVGPIFPTMPVNATSMLNLPMDCAEQNMYSFAANMYTTMYMRLISQRNLAQEKESFYHMNIGYQRQLSFMKADGSFGLFRSDWNQSSSSVWLTAFCARIFQEATFYEWENYLYIDPNVISQAVAWILRHQTPEGSFYEVTWLPDRKVNNTWPANEFDLYQHRNISLTAHVLITLETVKDLSGGLGSQVALSSAKAVRWLEVNLKLLEERGTPFEVAIVAYALLMAKSSSAQQAFNILSFHARRTGEFTYWGREDIPDPPSKLENQKQFSMPRLPYKYDAENIETTAYALLVHVARQEVKIEPIVKWLNSQRLTDGGWASTQDSVWAMKALMDYTAGSRIRDVSSLVVTIEVGKDSSTKTLRVNDKNIAKLQSIEIAVDSQIGRTVDSGDTSDGQTLKEAQRPSSTDDGPQNGDNQIGTDEAEKFIFDSRDDAPQNGDNQIGKDAEKIIFDTRDDDIVDEGEEQKEQVSVAKKDLPQKRIEGEIGSQEIPEPSIEIEVEAVQAGPLKLSDAAGEQLLENESKAIDLIDDDLVDETNNTRNKSENGDLKETKEAVIDDKIVVSEILGNRDRNENTSCNSIVESESINFVQNEQVLRNDSLVCCLLYCVSDSEIQENDNADTNVDSSATILVKRTCCENEIQEESEEKTLTECDETVTSDSIVAEDKTLTLSEEIVESEIKTLMDIEKSVISEEIVQTENNTLAENKEAATDKEVVESENRQTNDKSQKMSQPLKEREEKIEETIDDLCAEEEQENSAVVGKDETAVIGKDETAVVGKDATAVVEKDEIAVIEKDEKETRGEENNISEKTDEITIKSEKILGIDGVFAPPDSQISGKNNANEALEIISTDSMSYSDGMDWEEAQVEAHPIDEEEIISHSQQLSEQAINDENKRISGLDAEPEIREAQTESSTRGHAMLAGDVSGPSEEKTVEKEAEKVVVPTAKELNSNKDDSGEKEEEENESESKDIVISSPEVLSESNQVYMESIEISLNETYNVFEASESEDGNKTAVEKNPEDMKSKNDDIGDEAVDENENSEEKESAVVDERCENIEKTGAGEMSPNETETEFFDAENGDEISEKNPKEAEPMDIEFLTKHGESAEKNNGIVNENDLAEKMPEKSEKEDEEMTEKSEEEDEEIGEKSENEDEGIEVEPEKDSDAIEETSEKEDELMEDKPEKEDEEMEEKFEKKDEEADSTSKVDGKSISDGNDCDMVKITERWSKWLNWKSEIDKISEEKKEDENRPEIVDSIAKSGTTEEKPVEDSEGLTPTMTHDEEDKAEEFAEKLETTEESSRCTSGDPEECSAGEDDLETGEELSKNENVDDPAPRKPQVINDEIITGCLNVVNYKCQENMMNDSTAAEATNVSTSGVIKEGFVVEKPTPEIVPIAEDCAQKLPQGVSKLPQESVETFSSSSVVDSICTADAKESPTMSEESPQEFHSRKTEITDVIEPMETEYCAGEEEVNNAVSVAKSVLDRSKFKIEAEQESESVVETPKDSSSILPLITEIFGVNGQGKKSASEECQTKVSKRSREEIVSRYRSTVPISGKIAGEDRENLKRWKSASADVELARNHADIEKIGSPIEESLAKEWSMIMRQGLPKLTKEQIMAKHPPVENCPALITPRLNPYLQSFMSTTFTKKDQQLVSAQKQLSAAITAVGKALSVVLKQKAPPKLLENLGEAGQILANLHHENFQARRSYVAPGIGIVVESIAGGNAVDEFLFESTVGEDLQPRNEEENIDSGENCGLNLCLEKDRQRNDPDVAPETSQRASTITNNDSLEDNLSNSETPFFTSSPIPPDEQNVETPSTENNKWRSKNDFDDSPVKSKKSTPRQESMSIRRVILEEPFSNPFIAPEIPPMRSSGKKLRPVWSQHEKSAILVKNEKPIASSTSNEVKPVIKAEQLNLNAFVPELSSVKHSQGTQNSSRSSEIISATNRHVRATQPSGFPGKSSIKAFSDDSPTNYWQNYPQQGLLFGENPSPTSCNPSKPSTLAKFREPSSAFVTHRKGPKYAEKNPNSAERVFGTHSKAAMTFPESSKHSRVLKRESKEENSNFKVPQAETRVPRNLKIADRPAIHGTPSHSFPTGHREAYDYYRRSDELEKTKKQFSGPSNPGTPVSQTRKAGPMGISKNAGKRAFDEVETGTHQSSLNASETCPNKSQKLIKGRKAFLDWYQSRQRIAGDDAPIITPYRVKKTNRSASNASTVATIPANIHRTNSGGCDTWIPTDTDVEMRIIDDVVEVQRIFSPSVSGNQTAIQVDLTQPVKKEDLDNDNKH